jgi:hypothetical protein
MIEVVPGEAADVSALRGRKPPAADELIDLDEVGNTIVQACQQVVSKVTSGLKAARPDELEMTFGVSLSAEGGIPLITKASGEATFEVRAQWNFTDEETGKK